METIKLLYIDLFCGAGGLTEGVEKSTYKGEKCANVIIAINHDVNAIASHSANHPDALHFTEDIRTVAMKLIIEHVNKFRDKYPFALVVLHSSLECTNFSKAKGGQPRDADSRTLAEHIFSYIEAINPDYIQIENVEEFMCWGDLDENGKPISKDKGRKYMQWVEHVKQYGYAFKHRILNAADYGAYTSRKRFFGIFAKHGLPIVFPKPTHSKTGSKDLFDTMKKWKPVKDFLDFSDEGKSIFTRKKPLSDKTLERIYAGLIKFVAGGKDNFLSAYEQRPARAITTTGGNQELVQTVFLGRYNGQQNQEINAVSVDKPAPTLIVKDRLSLISSFFMNYSIVLGQYSGTDKPCPAVMTVPKQRIVSCKFIDQQFGNSKPTSLEQPLGCITKNPKYNLVSYLHLLMNPQYSNTGGSIENPCFTIIAQMDKKPPYLISTETGGIAIEVYETDTEPMIRIKQFMALYGIIDIKMRMLKIPELKRIMGFPEDYTLIGTQTEQKKYIGNAVEVNMAKCLCEALVQNYVEMNF